MSTTWILSMKPTFLNEMLALVPKEAHQLQQKLVALLADPTPDAKVKKQLKHLDGKLHRLRSGDYRVLYTFAEPYVSVLSLRRRNEDTYDEDLDAEFLGGMDVELPESVKAQAGSRWIAKPADTPKPAKPIPTPLTEALLKRLRVPTAHIAKLLAVTTEDELLNCPGVPDDVLLTVDQALFERPLDQLLSQPDLVASSVDDLLRYREGSLEAFLLRLNPVQEKLAKWSSRATGPTLLKGSAGTGKSTVALHRVRSMIEGLRKGGVAKPKILFTTYTHALVKFSQQLLGQLLGADASLVSVRTADSLVREISAPGHSELPLASDEQQREALATILASMAFVGNRLQQRAQAHAIERLARDYLLDEVNTVIDARGITSLESYLAAHRPGRLLSLNVTQRTAVWKVHEKYVTELQTKGIVTWQQLRARAAAIVAEGKGPKPYDAVVVDEAQDLDPSVIQMLVGMAATTSRLFLTADANQSIYGGAFRWSDVHEGLRFTGRVSVLRANHRSTREIGEAARNYLAQSEGAVLDGAEKQDDSEPVYMNTGPLPVVRAVDDEAQEAALLARFLPGAARDHHLGNGSCAVFCPTQEGGRRLAEKLVNQGVSATFMTGKDLDLKRPGVKIMTLKSCKGLEFPIVAVAGFTDRQWPFISEDASDAQRSETLTRERRGIYVGMTRAMRALLVVVPSGTDAPLLTGFSPSRWNTGAAEET